MTTTATGATLDPAPLAHRLAVLTTAAESGDGDPETLLRDATALTTDALTARGAAYALRDNASVSAHVDYRVKPVRIYKDTLGKSRGLFNRMVQRANRQSLLPAIRQAAHDFGMPAESGDDLLAVAAAAGTAAEAYHQIAAAARTIRDDVGCALMDGYYGTPMTNARFAEIVSVTSARAAQIRYGDNGATPQADA